MIPARDELVARVTANLEAVRERIASAGRDPGTVTIVAVCKTLGPEAPLAAAACGLSDVGENYAAELVAHHDASGDAPLTWHFLGQLQRNKLARLAPRVAVYQSIASERDAENVARHAAGARCYVQVDVSGRPGRHGCAPDAVARVAAAARDQGLALEGLMCVASPDPAAAAGEFAAAAQGGGRPRARRVLDGDVRGPRGRLRRGFDPRAAGHGPVRAAAFAPLPAPRVACRPRQT